MLNQNDKIERFAEVIDKSAQKQCKKTTKKAEAYRSKELESLTTQSEKELKARLDFETHRLASETNRQISLLHAESTKKAFETRSSITDKVFAKAKEKLEEYAKSDAYAVLLEKSIISLCESIDGKVVVYVRKEDEETAKQIVSNNGLCADVKSSTKVEIGGAYASDEDENVFVYDTLEMRLESQREVFMTTSGLAINE